MNQEQTFKIVSKNANGVKIRTLSGDIAECTWNQFNENFDLTDKFHCKFKPESLEKVNKIDNLILEATMALLRIGVLSKEEYKGVEITAAYGALGNISRELEKLGMNNQEFLSEVEKRLNILHNGDKILEKINRKDDLRNKGYGPMGKKKTNTEKTIEWNSMTLGDHPEFQKVMNLKN